MRTYPGSVHLLADHSGGIFVSHVLMVFLYFAQFLFIHYCCIYFLFAFHFSSQTRTRENRLSLAMFEVQCQFDFYLISATP